MANSYDEGNKVRVFGTYKSTGGSVADPTVVRLKYRKPGSTMATLTYSTSSTSSITRISTGAYRADLVADTEGEWLYQWDSSGAIRASAEKIFRVEPGLR